MYQFVVETRRNEPRLVRNLCVPVCGYRAGYFGLGFASLEAQFRLKSKMPGRILKSVRGSLGSAESMPTVIFRAGVVLWTEKRSNHLGANG